MISPFNLLLVCDNPAACASFQESLQTAGFRLVSVCGWEGAVSLPFNAPVDGILVCREDVHVGTLGSHLKGLFRDAPVVLISTGCETVAPPHGIDGVIYTNALDDETAHILAWLFRDELIEQSYPPKILELDDERFGSVVVPTW